MSITTWDGHEEARLELLRAAHGMVTAIKDLDIKGYCGIGILMWIVNGHMDDEIINPDVTEAVNAFRKFLDLDIDYVVNRQFDNEFITSEWKNIVVAEIVN
jgi:hypothetical protein